MYQVRINHTFGVQIFNAATLKKAEELQAKIYNAFADNNLWIPLHEIEIITK